MSIAVRDVRPVGAVRVHHVDLTRASEYSAFINDFRAVP